MSCQNKGDWMRRRSKVKYSAIHVTIPTRLLEDFDETLRYNQSRSALIANLIQQHLACDEATIVSSTTRQLIAALHARDDVEPLVKSLLLQILSE
jgi:metal-responsive CopG/Arc/MetJ family transcriptional regulator